MKRETPSLLDTLAKAADLLVRDAHSIRIAHTVRGKWPADEASVKAEYDEIRATAKQLLLAHKYMSVNPLGGPAKVFDACADAIRAGDSVEMAMANFGLAWADKK